MIYLPFPPSVNNYYSVANGRKILSKRGRAYKKEAAYLLAKQGVRSRRIAKAQVFITVNPPDRRRRDLDNLLKPILDVLTEASVLVDDSCVRDLRIVRYEVKKGGQVSVLVTDLKEGTQ